MRKKSILLTVITLTTLTLFLPFSCKNEGVQSQFRGSNTGTDLPEEWGNDKNIRWTYNIEGRGWSSPIISGNYVFITTAYNVTDPPAADEEPPPPPQTQPAGGQRTAGPPAGQAERQGPPPPPREDTTYKSQLYRWEVICLDLKSGTELWRQVASEGNPRTATNNGNGYASETPATDGKKVFAYFGMKGIFCYDLKGNLLWSKDLGAYKTLNGWGTGSSPVIYNGILYIQADNEVNSFLVALDAETGDERWRVEREEKTNYSTPIIWKNRIRSELVAGGKTIRSYEPETGRLLWECRIGGEYNIPSSSADENILYTGNAGGPENPGNLFAIKAGAQGDITFQEGESTNEWIAWSINNAGTGNPSPLLYNGLIYVLASRGGDISCFDSATGEMVYKQKVERVAACWASPWAFQDKIYFTDERGITYIIRAGKNFELLSQNRITDRFWASPAYRGDTYIFKGVNKVYCVGK